MKVTSITGASKNCYAHYIMCLLNYYLNNFVQLAIPYNMSHLCMIKHTRVTNLVNPEHNIFW